jgi:hypothetical protein
MLICIMKIKWYICYIKHKTIKMKKIITLFALAVSAFGIAQESSKWTVGFGVNAIDNTSTQDAVYFQTKDWNVAPVISKFSASYDVQQHLAVGTEVAINKYMANKTHNGVQGAITSDLNFVAVDVNAKYNVDHFFTQSKWFDASVIGGVGFFWLGTEANQSVNPGVALDFWLADGYGIRLQTLGRVALDNNKIGNNHIQHSVEFIFKF